MGLLPVLARQSDLQLMHRGLDSDRIHGFQSQPVRDAAAARWQCPRGRRPQWQRTWTAEQRGDLRRESKDLEHHRQHELPQSVCSDGILIIDLSVALSFEQHRCL